MLKNAQRIHKISHLSARKEDSLRSRYLFSLLFISFVQKRLQMKFICLYSFCLW